MKRFYWYMDYFRKW